VAAPHGNASHVHGDGAPAANALHLSVRWSCDRVLGAGI
jgi:hypothetical protein